jgi:hypothetical protein
MRYFRTADAALYETVRLQLDAAWGHNAPTTCIAPAAAAPRDSQGLIVLAVNDEFCTYSVVVDLLPQLLASVAVAEINEATYRAAVNPPLV